jgi:hypothetical protein
MRADDAANSNAGRKKKAKSNDGGVKASLEVRVTQYTALLNALASETQQEDWSLDEVAAHMNANAEDPFSPDETRAIHEQLQNNEKIMIIEEKLHLI